MSAAQYLLGHRPIIVAEGAKTKLRFLMPDFPQEGDAAAFLGQGKFERVRIHRHPVTDDSALSSSRSVVQDDQPAGLEHIIREIETGLPAPPGRAGRAVNNEAINFMFEMRLAVGQKAPSADPGMPQGPMPKLDAVG